MLNFIGDGGSEDVTGLLFKNEGKESGGPACLRLKSSTLGYIGIFCSHIPEGSGLQGDLSSGIFPDSNNS